jgi:hypothetical protein
MTWLVSAAGRPGHPVRPNGETNTDVIPPARGGPTTLPVGRVASDLRGPDVALQLRGSRGSPRQRRPTTKTVYEDRRKSDDGMTLGGLMWLRGKVAHGEGDFEDVGPVPWTWGGEPWAWGGESCAWGEGFRWRLRSELPPGGDRNDPRRVLRALRGGEPAYAPAGASQPLPRDALSVRLYHGSSALTAALDTGHASGPGAGKGRSRSSARIQWRGVGKLDPRGA